MIAEVDNQILQWTTEVLGESIATLRPPAQAQRGRGVGIYLLDVLPEPREHLARRQRLQAWLKYLITCWDESAPEAHRLLGTLLESAMQHPEFEIVAEPPGAEVWRAFGIVPQPCLTLRTRTWKELEPRPVKLVRKAVFETVSGCPLQAVVLGPEAIPLCDAEVELPALRLATLEAHASHGLSHQHLCCPAWVDTVVCTGLLGEAPGLNCVCAIGCG